MIICIEKKYDGRVVNSIRDLLVAIDLLGGILILSMAVCLVLAFQWGGNHLPWSSPTIIALFCVFGAIMCFFLFWERYKGTDAIVPLGVLRNRSQIGSSIQNVSDVMRIR
jgi:hypothetical protein